MSVTKQTSTRSAADSHLRRRVSLLKQRFVAWGVEALLITNPRDVRYLTGFVGDDSWAVVASRARRVTVISDFRFHEQIKREAPQVALRIRKKGLVDELAGLMKQQGFTRVGLQSQHVSLALRKVLVKKLGGKALVTLDDGMLQQRAVKDETEVKTICRALKIQQEAFQRTRDFIHVGQTESQIAAFLEYQMRLLGADRPSFPTIVAVDANASLPHAVPGSKKVKKGSTVLIDWGAKYQGYCSDLTRMIAVDRMRAKIREIYQIVREAQLAAIDAITPGCPLRQIDAVAREIIQKAGYGEHFGHSLGHGLGLDIHEQPTLARATDGVLKPGHVVTVEPGIYLPGVGGVRIEDDVLVTDRGAKVLSRLPTDLESAII